MMIETLTSAKNPLLKAVRRAADRGEPGEDGWCVAEGFHLLEEALRSGCQVETILLAAGTTMDVPVPEKVRILQLPRGVFETVSTTDHSQGVLSLVRAPSWSVEQFTAALSLTVVLDGIQEPGNAGAIVRAAEAFGVSGVVFLKGTVSPFNPKSLRASAGSLFRLPFLYGVLDETFGELVRGGALPVYVASPEAEMCVHEADLRGPCALVFGSEARGVRPEIAREGQRIRIPTRGVESLNAAVAAGVILYEAQRQRSGV
jgi:RNA methyltransferase, TrmH family